MERAIAAFANYLLWWGRGTQDPAKFPEAFYNLLGRESPVFSQMLEDVWLQFNLVGLCPHLAPPVHIQTDRLQRSYFTYSLST